MDELTLDISLGEQRLKVVNDGEVEAEYQVATARNGAGEIIGSECTPRGWHAICAKIGEGSAPGAVFVEREPTGEIYATELRAEHPERDWILTRILWLTGLEEGKNLSGDVDTRDRHVYIHGCPDEDEMGVPSSHGCVKMRNSDVVALFDIVSEGTRVYIHE
ncbi:MAG: L,D-transpeptidase [Gammaproteobacteria bacterium]|nr:MAG: L,D-transpeptidase [Gammaproteobacteria bacterium]